MSPKVSVVMSVYNGEKHLREAIDSILNQTFTDFEFIIINDGSTDRTKEILESYFDPRIRLFHQKNIGLTKSLNRGLEIVRGEYIARQDADDISEQERLYHEVKLLDNNSEVGLVGTYASFIDRNGKQMSVWKTPENHGDIKSGLMKENCFCHGSVMFRKNCIDTVGYYREYFKYTQDYDLWLRISELYKVANINKVLYKFRRDSNTISRKKLSEQLNYHLLAIELAKERSQSGIDSLSDIKTKEIELILKGRYKLGYSEINKFKSNIFLRYFSEAIITGDYIGSFSLWLRAFLFEPKKWKIRFLIEEILRPLSNHAY